MKQASSLDSIGVLLHRALPTFRALPGIREEVRDIPLSRLHLARSVENILEKRNEWLGTVPEFEEVHDWVEIHWDPDRQTHPPEATVTTSDKWGHAGEIQLDALAATCKLILAAAGHGTETVSRCAMEFAGHGMIEVRSFYLLKGLPVLNARSLDDYCNLLTYPEALQKIAEASSVGSLAEGRSWPPESADNVCVLEARSFEHRRINANYVDRRVSRLLQCGTETLLLILGLVWGTGFRVFGGWSGVAESVAATLPFFGAAASEGRWSRQALLTLSGFRWPSSNRPLNEAEVLELTGKYATLPEGTRRVLALAMRRLRDGTERIELEDRVIDVSIALEALFMEGEQWDQKRLVSRRASWYFADSLQEREQTRNRLKEFYDERSDIVHGKTPVNLTPAEENQRWSRLAAVEDVVRASVKAMISEGPPPDWEDSKDLRSIRHDPPRSETDIPSVRSESLSWTISEQKQIDQALEAVWKREIDAAPALSPNAEVVVHHGINAEAIEQWREQGIPYVISVPIRLYMAHPKWPQREGNPVDERTKYYCEKDVERHLRRWQLAADEKRMHRFELSLEDPAMYLPERFDMWRRILQQRGQL